MRHKPREGDLMAESGICSQNHKLFFAGDGAGVGKGRTIAAIIYENYMQHRKKAIWLSVSNDLRVDAERDLRDVGLTKLEVHSLNKVCCCSAAARFFCASVDGFILMLFVDLQFRYAKISGRVNGSVKKGVLFSTYSSLIGESQGGAKAKYKTRLKQIVHWCGKGFDGVVSAFISALSTCSRCYYFLSSA